MQKPSIEVYQLVAGQYVLLAPNDRNHYPIEPMGVELGLWQGQYLNLTLPWLRWWDDRGNLLLTGEEKAERVEQENQRLREKLRSLGIDPDRPE